MKLRWAINRTRVKLARMIWPRINPLPPLFTAITGPVSIGEIAVYDGEELLYATKGCVLRGGDSFALGYNVELCGEGGVVGKVRVEMSPVDGVPVKLYEGSKVGKLADDVTRAFRKATVAYKDEQ